MQTADLIERDIVLDSGPGEYHIEAARSLVDRPLRTLKHDDLFGVFDKHGDCRAGENAPEGLYFHDTRFLSQLELRLGGRPPLLLGSVLLDDNAALIVDLTNADLHAPDGALALARDTLFARRQKFLAGSCCYERISVMRYADLPAPVSLELRFASDFADLFEVRGEERPRRGERRAEVLDPARVRLSYEGLDGVSRSTTIHFDPAPAALTTAGARWNLALAEADTAEIRIAIACACGTPSEAPPPPPLAALRKVRRSSRARIVPLSRIASSNALFNEVIARAASDVDMLLTETEHGLYPYAGVPWYSTIFGRDGIITGLELLWIAPGIAKGVLQALAATQARDVDPAADAEPGKIVHEMRGGEMARLGEVPFRRYYGSVDSTPLFVTLAGAYYRRTGDLETIRSLWPNIEAALAWIDSFGDRDRDGFVEYHRMTDRGLANQGWKDSHDSIFHADGSLAEGPIALCEVQAYVFAAKRAAAEMAGMLGKLDLAFRLETEAEALRKSFEAQFWLDDLGTYALALDGRKRPCRVRASNAGHALFAGIAAPDRAECLARLLTGAAFFSGWGVRTVAAGEARYNPMSYHNGSVWPHDNALIAMGLARYGHKQEAARIFQALVDAALYDEFRRLPELFCGFRRRRGRGPTHYPVACSPQAWAAAAPFALIGASLGIELDHQKQCFRLDQPVLPPMLDRIELPPVTIGASRARLRFRRVGDDVTVAVSDKTGPATVMIVK